MNDLDAVARQYKVPLDNFADVAGRYCALIEDWYAHSDGSDIYELIEKIDPLLGEMYWRATQLPETHVWFAEEDDDEDEGDEFVAIERSPGYSDDDRARDALRAAGLEAPPLGLMHTLDKYLGGLNLRRGVFHPYHEVFETVSDDEVMYHSLGDDLSSVYGWCKEGLSGLVGGNGEAVFAAVFEWREDFATHVGDHLTGAIRALYYVLHRHGDDDWVRLPARSKRNSAEP